MEKSYDPSAIEQPAPDFLGELDKGPRPRCLGLNHGDGIGA
jgi:hypothetical protein